MFPILGYGFVRADELNSQMSLISYQTEDKVISKSKTKYRHIFDHNTNKMVPVHTIVNKTVNANFTPPNNQHSITHHADFNPANNSPDNLIWMGHKDHFKYHSTVSAHSWELLTPELKAQRIANISAGTIIGNAAMSEETKKAARLKQGIGSSLSFKKRKQNVVEWACYIEKLSKAARQPRPNASINLTGKPTAMSNQRWKFSINSLSILINLAKNNKLNRLLTLNAANNSQEFLNSIALDNTRDPSFSTYKIDTSAFSAKALKRMFEHFNILGWKNFVCEVIPNFNHKIISVEHLEETQDTGCITVGESLHNWHTFATEAGVFVKNSLQEDYFFSTTASGRGSRVETLPGGSEDFGTNLLREFQNKIFRGLRIPTSYMGSSATAGSDPQTNDGKVGIAYIEELRFAKFISRLQDRINEVYDAEFKIYLKVCGLKVDDEVFQIQLPDPANFALYRQAALDADLISSFSNIQEVQFLSRRFILKRYLGLSDDEIQMNEVQLKEEKNLKDTADVPIMQQLYDDSFYKSRDAVKVINEPSSETSASEDDIGDPSSGLLHDEFEDTPFASPEKASDEPEDQPQPETPAEPSPEEDTPK
jgi:Bacteriophage T4-like portal protein (Gp20)